MAQIIFDTVDKSFGDVHVLKDINMHIRDEEFMVFVGPSGCGKSTALRMIAGLESITRGNLSIGDRVVNTLPPKDRDVAMVFQSYALYPHMTVRENIAFGLRLRKTAKDEIERLVNNAADILGLKELLERKPKALSGGQRQRVALGRAIVRQPSVFLFDEPLSNLDAELRVHMRAELSKLQRRLKTTTVYVTHDQVEAMTMGHRIAVLAPLTPSMETNLMQVGSPLELYDRPQNLFVARFIGTPNMNIVQATVSEDGTRLDAPGFQVPMPSQFSDAARDYRGRKVALGVRPEHIGSPEDWTARTSLKGEVEIIETIGHEVVLHVRCEGEPLIAKMASHKHMPGFGDIVELVLKSDEIHLFDPDTERRLGLPEAEPAAEAATGTTG
jgi:multiple sugar transport system ATP-binding protein